jgi:hypothetical protein
VHEAAKPDADGKKQETDHYEHGPPTVPTPDVIAFIPSALQPSVRAGKRILGLIDLGGNGYGVGRRNGIVENALQELEPIREPDSDLRLGLQGATHDIWIAKGAEDHTETEGDHPPGKAQEWWFP